MVLNIQNKKNIVNKINKISELSVSVIIANPKNISTNLLNQLRKDSRNNNVIIYMIKNTLFKKAIHKTKIECLNNTLQGQILIGFSMKNPENAPKLFNKFSENNKNFKILTACLNKKILSHQEIHNLANLPTQKEAIIKIMLTIKYATIGRILNILSLIKINNTKIKI